MTPHETKKAVYALAVQLLIAHVQHPTRMGGWSIDPMIDSAYRAAEVMVERSEL